MALKLYVGNLSYKSTEEDLKSLFSTVGDVKDVKLITDRFSGHSRGFAFVEMSTEEEAQKAIAELNGKDFGGREIIVNEARAQGDRSTSRWSQREGGRGSRGRKEGGFRGGRRGGGGFDKRF